MRSDLGCCVQVPRDHVDDGDAVRLVAPAESDIESPSSPNYGRALWVQRVES